MVYLVRQLLSVLILPVTMVVFGLPRPRPWTPAD
jgi:hypothetical protein